MRVRPHVYAGARIEFGGSHVVKKDEAPAATAAAPAPEAAAELKLDESKLPAYNAFNIADLDASKDACTLSRAHSLL